MSINKTRSALYVAAKFLGDVQAGNKAFKKKSADPIFKRLARRLTGRLSARFLGWLHR